MIFLKIKINLSVLITIALLIISIIISSAANKDANHTDEAYTTYASEDEINTNEKEMRGLWVSFITLDMTDSDMSFEAFRKKFDKIVNTAVNYKLNTLIVQVRPFCDALYKSEVFPYSHILTGTQDKNPGYDPLEYMCKTAHSHGLEIHAWINPYRVATSTTPKKLSNNNPYVNNPDIGMELDSGIYLNPAKKASRKLVCDGISISGVSLCHCLTEGCFTCTVMVAGCSVKVCKALFKKLICHFCNVSYVNACLVLSVCKRQSH